MLLLRHFKAIFKHIILFTMSSCLIVITFTRKNIKHAYGSSMGLFKSQTPAVSALLHILTVHIGDRQTERQMPPEA